MPKIAGVATATPKNTITQENIKIFANKVFNENDQLRRLMPVFDNAMVEKRYFTADLEWFGQKHDFTEVNDLYIESALKLSEEVVCKLADQFGIKTTDFDIVFFISTTGLSTPSIDARLFKSLSYSSGTDRCSRTLWSRLSNE